MRQHPTNINEIRSELGTVQRLIFRKANATTGQANGAINPSSGDQFKFRLDVRDEGGGIASATQYMLRNPSGGTGSLADFTSPTEVIGVSNKGVPAASPIISLGPVGNGFTDDVFMCGKNISVVVHLSQDLLL